MKFTIESDHIKGNLAYGELSISPIEKNGYRPFELFVSSLAGCSGTLLRTILTKRKYPFQKIQMEVSSIRNPEEANRIERLSFTAHVLSDEPLMEELAEKIAPLVIKNCGMIQSVIHSIEISFVITSIPLNGDYR